MPVIDVERSMPRSGIRRLASFSLTTPNARQLSEFYQQALNFRLLGIERRSGPDFDRLMGSEGGASAIVLGLGDEVVEFLEFDRPGRPYPDDTASSDLCFQHFAVVVADMRLGYQRLSAVAGWTAISTDGPQKLPASSGGVTAFKFRDPDGHPLELLAFADGKSPERWKTRSKSGLFLGIDHSAITVFDSELSIAFYKALGLRVAGRSFNTGSEQDRLDALRAAEVEVTALEVAATTPHIELLCYRSAPRREKIVYRSRDVAATRMLFEADGWPSEEAMQPRALLDPDGHHLMIVASTNRLPRAQAIENSGSPGISL